MTIRSKLCIITKIANRPLTLLLISSPPGLYPIPPLLTSPHFGFHASASRNRYNSSSHFRIFTPLPTSLAAAFLGPIPSPPPKSCDHFLATTDGGEVKMQRCGRWCERRCGDAEMRCSKKGNNFGLVIQIPEQGLRLIEGVLHRWTAEGSEENRKNGMSFLS